MPVVNIHTIGAGGGSIAYVEAGGLRVGPESAGADPGPGVLRPRRNASRPSPTRTSCSGASTLPLRRRPHDARRRRGRAGASRTSARSSGLEPSQLAEGICDVINAKMAQAIRTLTVEKGIEPRDFALVAFGGAGPMHAVVPRAGARDRRGHRAAASPGRSPPGGCWRRRSARTRAAPTSLHSRRSTTPTWPRTLRELEDEGFASLEDEGIGRDTGRVEHARRYPLRRSGVHADDPARRRR